MQDRTKLVDVKETERQTMLCLVAVHALVQLDDGTAPTSTAAQHCTQLVIRHHFQFFYPQAHVDHLIPARGKTLASVKGALEMIRGMLKDCPTWYDETYNI